MAEKSEQERARQEDLMAGGPVSRGASNKEAPMNRDQQEEEKKQRKTGSTGPDPKHPDYNRLIGQTSTSTSQGQGMATNRDLGTVGGGTIPNDGEPRGGRNTSNSTVGAEGTSAGGVVGTGSHRDRGSMSDTGMDTSTNNANEIDRQGQSNIGGRNPGQPRKSMGDQDATHGGRGQGANEEIIDPMTSRAPDKVNKKDEGS